MCVRRFARWFVRCANTGTQRRPWRQRIRCCCFSFGWTNNSFGRAQFPHIPEIETLNEIRANDQNWNMDGICVHGCRLMVDDALLRYLTRWKRCRSEKYRKNWTNLRFYAASCHFKFVSFRWKQKQPSIDCVFFFQIAVRRKNANVSHVFGTCTLYSSCVAATTIHLHWHNVVFACFFFVFFFSLAVIIHR